MEEPSRGERLRRRAGLLGGPLLAAGMLVVPVPQGMTGIAWRMAAVASWMAVWWITEAVPIPATALLPLVLFPALGILSSLRTATSYGNHLIFLFLGGFVLARGLERWGLHRRLALYTLAVVGGGPRRILLGFMIAGAVLSMWMSNSAATLVMVPIGMAVARQAALGSRLGGSGGEAVDRRVERDYGGLLMLGLAYGASIGGIATLVGTPTNLVFVGAAREIFPAGPEVGFLRWMLLGLPLATTFLAAAWMVLPWAAGGIPLAALHLGGADRSAVGRELAGLGPPSTAERRVGAAFAATALLWILREPIHLAGVRFPGWAALLPEPAFLHDATVGVAAALALLLVPAGGRRAGEPRRPLVTWEDVQSGTPWGILLLFGGGLALAAGFQHTGLADWIGGRLAGLGHVPIPLLVFAVCLLVTFLTEVTSNTATATMLMPVMAATARGADLHPFLLMLPATLSASCAFMLPVATPPNAIVFGTGCLQVPRMARAGIWLNLIGVILITLAVLLLGGPVLGIRPELPDWAQ